MKSARKFLINFMNANCVLIILAVQGIKVEVDTGIYLWGKCIYSFFRTFVKIEDNVAYFQNGSKCGNYNKLKTARVHLICGSSEDVKFIKKINGCQYEFNYTTKMACNSVSIKLIIDKISLYLNEIQ
jgi:hypothetical protein